MYADWYHAQATRQGFTPQEKAAREAESKKRRHPGRYAAKRNSVCEQLRVAEPLGPSRYSRLAVKCRRRAGKEKTVPRGLETSTAK